LRQQLGLADPASYERPYQAARFEEQLVMNRIGNDRISASDRETEYEVFDGYLYIEFDNYYVECDRKPVYNLTRKEFLLLSLLACKCGRTVKHQDLWDRAWGTDATFNGPTFRVHIASLRRKISAYGLEIISLPHIGYRLVRSNHADISNHTTNKNSEVNI